MSTMWLWISVVFFSSLNLHNAAAQAQMCEEPFKAAIIVTVNVTFPITASFFDPDLVHFRKTLRFTEEEIDREREAAMRFYKDMYGLDFTSIEPNDQGQRILGNATFEPSRIPINLTYVFNNLLVSGQPNTKCFPASAGGFWVPFSGPMSPFNFTYVFNSWLVSGRPKTKCFPAENGGFRVRFSGPMMLHGEYGGEEGKLVSTVFVNNRDLLSI